VCGFDLSALDVAASIGKLRDEPFVLSDYSHVLLTEPSPIITFDTAEAVTDQTGQQWRTRKSRPLSSAEKSPCDAPPLLSQEL
jgi:hypothetical protein